MSETRSQCAGKTYGAYRDVSGRVYSCTRWGTVERDGKWYCWQHDPERVKVDKEKKRAKWQAKQDKNNARYVRQAAMSRVCEGVSTEDLKRLEVGAVSRLLDGKTWDEMPRLSDE